MIKVTQHPRNDNFINPKNPKKRKKKKKGPTLHFRFLGYSFCFFWLEPPNLILATQIVSIHFNNVPTYLVPTNIGLRNLEARGIGAAMKIAIFYINFVQVTFCAKYNVFFLYLSFLVMSQILGKKSIYYAC